MNSDIFLADIKLHVMNLRQYVQVWLDIKICGWAVWDFKHMAMVNSLKNPRMTIVGRV